MRRPIFPFAPVTMVAAIATAVVLASSSSPAGAQDLITVTVQPGEGCEAIARRVYGDAEQYARIHAHNPQLGPMPHRLAPGTTLRVPRPQPPARLTRVHRRVERRAPAGTHFENARPGDALARGTQVRTHEASSAQIAFEDDARFVVRERTLVIVYGGRRRLTERRVTRAELQRGALRSRLPELAGRRPLDVETPTARASLDGDGVISVEEDGTSRVANHGRRVATVRAGGATVALPAGTGTVVRRGERPSAPRRLLAAPRWRADTTGPVIGFVGRGAALRGGFEPVQGAAGYRIEVARSPEGGELLTTLNLGPDARAFEAAGLPEGVVYVSVASIDSHGLEGRRSPQRAFSVRVARLVAPGGTPSTALDEIPRVWPGTWLIAPRGTDCALAGEEATSIATFRAPGRQRITCGAAELEVDVIEAVLGTSGAPIVRDRTTTVAISISPGSLPPLIVEAPDGFEVSRPRPSPTGITVAVRAPPQTPSEITLTVHVAAGSERIPIGSVVVSAINADRSPDIAVAPIDDEPTPERRPRFVTGANGDLLWPSLLALRDERAAGFGAYLYTSVHDAAGVSEPQVRSGVWARAQLPEVPLRIGFGSQIDLLARPSAPGRRGEADFALSVGGLILSEAELGLALDLTTWFPTRPEPESLGRVRLQPSLEFSWRMTEWLAARTRQGAIVDATGDGARLYAGAIGLDIMPLEWLAVGAELDVSAGRFADRNGAMLALGVAAEARYERLEVALGARYGLTDEAIALLGEWSAILTLRVFAR